jgi:hypothetical protein
MLVSLLPAVQASLLRPVDALKKGKAAGGARWLDARGGPTGAAGADSPHTPYDLAPGESVPLPLTLRAPHAPGDYLLEAGMLHEGVASFEDRGSPPLRLAVRVERGAR